MILTGLCRIGRDAEVRYTQNGDPVANVSVAWNYGRRDADGKRPSQWLELSLWGERAEKLEQYLKKGAAIVIVAADVHVETYEKRDGGTGAKLVGKLESIDFAGSREEGEQRQAAPAPAPAAAPAAKAPPPRSAPRGNAGGGSFDNLDDDIPF